MGHRAARGKGRGPARSGTLAARTEPSSSEAPIQLYSVNGPRGLSQVNYDDTMDFVWQVDDNDPNTQVSGKVGTKVEAHLDPSDPISGGDTGGSDAFNDLFGALQFNTASSWVRGHLMNHDLGGEPLYNNLFPITTAANGEHYHEVEKPIKAMLASGCQVDYRVQAEKRNDITSPDGAFSCDAMAVSGPHTGDRLHKVIYSLAEKVSSTRLYAGKGDQSLLKFSAVQHGKGNTIMRDTYSASSSNSWGHSTGTVASNVDQPGTSVQEIDMKHWDEGNTSNFAAGHFAAQFDWNQYRKW